MINRLARVRELLKRELGDILQREFVFPGVLVTVNAVDVTPDLRNGHVFLGIIGDEAQKRQVIAKLREKRGFLQKRLSRRVVLKYTPRLHFSDDSSVERGVHVLNLIEELDEPVGSGDGKDGDGEGEGGGDDV